MTQVSGILGRAIIANAEKISMPTGMATRFDPSGVNVVILSMSINKGMAYRVVILGKLLGNKHPEEVQLTIPSSLYPKLVKSISVDTPTIQ